MTAISKNDPFSDDKLQDIFQFIPNNDNRLIQGEIDNIEYKQNYNGSARTNYARIMAGFANNEGGYIIFGVDDTTRELIGMSNDKFEILTPEDIGNGLKNIFSPAIKFDKHVHIIDEKKLGLLYSFPLTTKPAIAHSNSGNDGKIRIGDIFYRYGARTERIQYPELVRIIEERQEYQLNRWLEFMQNAVRIGVDNVRLLNMLDGTVSGTGGQLILSEDLLNDINFIREGSFNETEGEPTLRIIGNVTAFPASLIEPTKIVDKPTLITTSDVYHTFLEQQEVDAPAEYLKQMCHGTSKFMPIYFYMQQSKFGLERTVEFLKSQETRSRSRDGIVERLSNDSACDQLVYKTTTTASAKCKHYKQRILDGTLNAGIPFTDIRYALKGIRMLSRDQVNPDQIFPVIRIWFDQYFTDKSSNLLQELKNTICYLDCLLYRPEDSSR